MWSELVRFWRLLVSVSDLAANANLGLISAGVAFFGMFAIFPAMAALIALFGLVADPSVVEGMLQLLSDIIPPQAFGLFEGQLTRLLKAGSDTLGLATLISIGVALWSTRAGVGALMSGINAVSGQPDRGGLRHAFVALMMTVSLIFVAIVALLLVVGAPIVISLLPPEAQPGWILEAVRWLVVLLVLLSALGLLYRYGPNRPEVRIGFFSPGAVLVVVFWFAASAGFSIYLTNFGRYNEVYGSIGAVVAMLMWLYISAYLILLGAALNVVLLGRR